MSRRLTDSANNKYAVEIGQNGLHYMGGTFVLNYGGKLLNPERNRALYDDDNNALRGAELDVDLHVKYRFTAPDARQATPQAARRMETEVVAMEFNGLFRHASIREALGDENIDFAPPPKGPTGIQTSTVGGNAWSILTLSKVKDAAWQVLRWTHTRDGMLKTPQMTAVQWPPLVWAANTPQWLDQFRGTHIADCAKVWETGGRPFLLLPEGAEAISTMNEPFYRALEGKIATRDALRESANQLNELFSRRPAAWT